MTGFSVVVILGLLTARDLPPQSNFQKYHALPGFTSAVEVKDLRPREIHRWLREMDNKRFKQWHPAHREYRVVRETPNYVGSRFYFREIVDGFEISGTWEVVYAEPPDTLIFKRRWQPVYWLLILTGTKNGTLVMNDMRYGTGWKWIDRPLGRIVERFYLTPEIQKAIDQHDREEFLMLGAVINNRNNN